MSAAGQRVEAGGHRDPKRQGARGRGEWARHRRGTGGSGVCQHCARLAARGAPGAALPAGEPCPAANAPATAAPRGTPDLPRLPKPQSTLTRDDSVSINRRSPQCFILRKSQN